MLFVELAFLETHVPICDVVQEEEEALSIYIPLQTRLTTGKYSSHVKTRSPRGVMR